MDDPTHVVLVDMDGVLADFDRRVVEALSARFPELNTVGARTEFYLHKAYPSLGERILEVTTAAGFFTSLALMDQALEGWAAIERAGFVPRICSAPLVRHIACAEEKRAWLSVHFGDRVARDAIIDRVKGRHAGIALIDDRPRVVGSAQAVWQHIVFDASYNRESKSPHRLSGWRDPRLADLLETARAAYTRQL